ncbi:MAG: hypothetical protein A2X86_13610 [Bdellovibrionales bacterium GWA2_49_15]|nr:MAG: hypothetical protein A2X86_13610 [Bdellovibrionales bacterium GWA2_49_15]HAZ13563.1 hypothetical protein [Bdellovibrionales bacterium]
MRAFLKVAERFVQIILICCLSTACALPESESITPATQFSPLFRAVQKPFLDGLEAIRHALPTNVHKIAPLKSIRELLEFHDQRVAWGHILSKNADGTTNYVMETIPAEEAATVIVLFQTTPAEGFNLRTEGTQLWLYDYATTPLWAGLVLLHELAHLEEASRNSTQDDEAWLQDELHAYQLELQAADLLSGGKVSHALRKYTASIKTKIPGAFFAAMNSLGASALYDQLEKTLEEILHSGPPRSGEESKLRYGMVLVSAGLLRFENDHGKLLEWMRILTHQHGPESMKKRI